VSWLHWPRRPGATETTRQTALRQRGSLTVWFTEAAIAAWKAELRATRGGQPRYSALARNCRTPMLVLPDDVPGHPLQTPIDVASLAPNAEITVFPWKEPGDLKRRTIRYGDKM
jgi:hypothetical protein